jgi:hypothetical protein
MFQAYHWSRFFCGDLGLLNDRYNVCVQKVPDCRKCFDGSAEAMRLCERFAKAVHGACQAFIAAKFNTPYPIYKLAPGPYVPFTLC